MNPNLKTLRDLGQSLWLDNITRQLLDEGTLARWISEYGLTGLTSNPTIFDQAISGSGPYDAGIRDKHRAGLSGTALSRSEERLVGEAGVSTWRYRGAPTL